MRASSLFNKNDMYSQFSSVVRSTGETHRVSQGWQAGQTGRKQTGRAVPSLASLSPLSPLLQLQDGLVELSVLHELFCNGLHPKISLSKQSVPMPC